MNNIKFLVNSSLGNLFESFDFYLFAMYAIPLNIIFFGHVNKTSTLWIFLVFAVGYFARMVGAVVFGFFGDKIGRIYSFKKTILLMGVSSLLFSALPTYNFIGMFSIVLVLALRFAQGVAYGGEQTGAIIVICEHIKKNKALCVTVVYLMGNIGIIFAQSLYHFFHCYFDKIDFLNISWRISYALAGILLIHAYFSRRNLNESEEYIENKIHNFKVRQIFKKYPKTFFATLGCMIGGQLYWGVFIVYFPNFVILNSQNPVAHTYIYYSMFIGLIFGNILGGVFANITSAKTALSSALVLTIASVVPLLFLFINHNSISSYFYIVVTIFSFFMGTISVPKDTLIACNLPVQYRFSILAISVAVSAFLFVGLPPFILSLFTHQGSMIAPTVILIIGFVVQLISVEYFYKLTKNNN
jgi:MFS family permease